MNEPTFEEMRPLLRPLAAMLLMHGELVTCGAPGADGDEGATTALVQASLASGRSVEAQMAFNSVKMADALMEALAEPAEPVAPPPVARTCESTEDVHFPKLLAMLDRVSKSEGCDATLRAEAARLIQEYDDDCIPF